MKKQTNQKKSGFTLIELLIVVVIIAVIAAIAIPAFGNAVTNARNTAKIGNATQVMKAMNLAAQTAGVTVDSLTQVEVEAYFQGTLADLGVGGVVPTWLNVKSKAAPAVWVVTTPAALAAAMYPVAP